MTRGGCRCGGCGAWSRVGARTLLCVLSLLCVLFLAPAQAFAGGASPGKTPSGGAEGETVVKVSSRGSASIEDVRFALDGFGRLAKGTGRVVAGAPEGYRFPLSNRPDVVVVCTSEVILMHVDESAAREVGLDLDSDEDVRALWSMVCALDEDGSMGGALLADAGVPYQVVTDAACTVGGYRYRFDARDADGERYATVTLASMPEGEAGTEAARAAGVDLGDGALWCDFAELVPSEHVAVEAAEGPLERIASFFSGMDYRPFWVSLKTGGAALAVSFCLGLLAAWRVMGSSSRLKGVLDSVFTIPMVLPPTVCGLLLLMLFGQSTPLGRWLIGNGISLVFTWQAAVISAVVVSFPLVYRTALGAFESLDGRMLDAARTLGWSELRIFRKIMLPLSWSSIAAGTVLAFARAMGEFGCTLFFAGNYAGVTQTIPIAIYFEWMGGDTDVALFWVVVVIAFSFLVVWGINAYTANRQGYRGGAGSRGRSLSGWAGRRRFSDAGIASAGDGLEGTGGDALSIDRAALRELFEEVGE